MNQPEPEIDKIAVFYERYTGKTDNEILDILRHRSNYQEAAVSAAMQLAIERGLISSEHDLLSPGFRQADPPRFRLFPPIANVQHSQRLIGSIFRLLYLLSLVPLIDALMSFVNGKTDRMLEAIAVGVFWAVLCFLFRKTGHILLMGLMLVVLIFVLTLSSLWILGQAPVNLVDWLMALVGTILPAYLILYVRQLMQAGRDKGPESPER
jgi:hypothetical protein